jgi:hypothetical protein
MVITNHKQRIMFNPFSKKSSIKLSKALELKEQIQEKLKSNHMILKLENSVLQGQKRNYDLKKIVKESDKLQENIITLKLLVQEANLKSLGNDKCISYYVYLLSEKKTQILNLTSMLRRAHEGTSEDDKGKKITLAKPIYTRPELEDWINNLKKECKEIEAKLTTLNDSIIVELPFKPI